jgi:hypothetical protein
LFKRRGPKEKIVQNWNKSKCGIIPK